MYKIASVAAVVVIAGLSGAAGSGAASANVGHQHRQGGGDPVFSCFATN